MRMRDNLHDHRKSYGKGELTVDSVDANPLQQFRTWFYQVQNGGSTDEPNAMTLTTVGEDNCPRGRVVLLKKYDETGFIFYTNYDSQKGKAIAHNPNVCLSFFWPDLATSNYRRPSNKNFRKRFYQLFPFKTERQSTRSLCFGTI